MAEHETVYKTIHDDSNNITLTHVVYALQVIGLCTFIGFVAGVIMNYVKLPDVQGTWLASHFRWQIRTFWYGLLWSVLGGLLVFFFIGYFILAVNYIWMIYRVIKGWVYLGNRRSMYSY